MDNSVIHDLFDDAYTVNTMDGLASFESIKIIPAEPESLTLEDKVARFDHVLGQLLISGKRCILGASFGKDSSVMCNLAMNTIVKLKQAGQLDHFSREAPAMVVVHSNTRVENPVASAFALQEASKIEQFAIQHDLPIQVHIVEPSMSNNYIVNILGGRTVATLPGMGAKCSVMMKVEPITRHKKRIFKEFGKDDVFTMIATRRDESTHRGGAMEKRGESEHALVKNPNNEWLLSPLADFTLDDIFMHIAEVRNGLHQTYSDFEDLIEHYRDLNSGACMVNVMAAGKASSGGCGGRSGCWTCARVREDFSLLNMTKEEQFKWLKPLNDFRNLIVYEHWNPDKRRWLARKVNEDGTINLLPVSYSAGFCADMLRYALTIQLREAKEAYVLGIKPRFEILREKDVIAIQLLWSRYGFHKGAEALEIWRDVMIYGNEYDMPEIDPYAASPYNRKDINDEDPGYRNLPFADEHYQSMFNGFRDIEAAAAGCERVVTKKGVYYSEANVDREFDVDDEGAAMLMDFELDHVIDTAKDRHATSVFHRLIRMGTVVLKAGSESEQNRMLMTANQIERLGLGDYENNPKALAERLNAFADGSLRHAQPGDYMAAKAAKDAENANVELQEDDPLAAHQRSASVTLG